MSYSTAKYCPVTGITVDNIFLHFLLVKILLLYLILLRLLGANSDIYNRINLELLHSSLVISSDQNLPTEI